MRPWTLRLLVLCLLLALGGAAGGAGAAVQPGERDGLKRLDADEEFVPGELIVAFREDVPAAARSSALRAREARTLRTIAPGERLVELPDGASVTAAAAGLERDPRVLYAEPNYIYKLTAIPNDPLFPELWGLDQVSDKDIDAPEAWDLHTGRKQVVVAVIDSGIAYGHPDLAPNIWINTKDPAGGGDQDKNGFPNDTRGWDFVQNDNTPLDFNGHGTHVAGTIGARGNNGLGVTGVNWNVSLMALRAADGNGSLTVASIVGAIRYACAKGARIVNGSFGGSSLSEAIANEIKSAACAKTLFVFAAGNSGWNLEGNTGVNDRSYPCELHLPSPVGRGATNVLCVGATDQNDVLADFSNYGVNSVHIAAPGVDTLSTWPDYSPVAGTEEGFEGTDPEFDTRWGDRFSDPGNALWGRTNLVSKTGAYSLTDSPGSGVNYADDSDTSIRRMGPINLSARVGCRIDYWLRLQTELGFDYFEIWTAPAPFSNPFDWDIPVSWSGSSGGAFIEMSDDLSSIDGRPNGYIRFGLYSDTEINFDGAYVDDMEIKCLVQNGADYQEIDGTSMATPHVAGVAALLLDRNPGLSVTQLKNAIQNGADVVPGLPVKDAKRLNARGALEQVADAPPQTTITAGPKGKVKAKKATFKFTSSEAGSTFQCKHMKGPWQACKSPKTYKKLKKGKHTFQVRAIDRAGNVDPSPAKRAWKIV